MSDPSDELRRSWSTNAAAWSATVRERKIESRRVATDDAVLDTVTAFCPQTVLDLGCGEGWLARALAERGMQVTGIDGSHELIAGARASGGADFHAISYEELIANPAILGATFDLVVANFSLLDEMLAPLLGAIRSLLKPNGVLVIQTVHPVFAAGGAYQDGWRVETFASFGGAFAAPMPWYFRTLTSWIAVLADCGFTLRAMREPLHPERLQPLSLILSSQA